MPATEGLSNVVLYATEAFNLGHQIRAVQSTDGFLGDTLGGNEAVEDPLWSGTHTSKSRGRIVTPTDLSGPERLKRLASEGDHFTSV